MKVPIAPDVIGTYERANNLKCYWHLWFNHIVDWWVLP